MGDKQLSKATRQVFRRVKQATLILMATSLIWRFIPYIFPIYATNLTQDRQAIELVSRQMLPLGTLLTQSQEQTAVVPLTEVSSHFIHAIIAAEDGRYYQHGALEIRAIGRSMVEAIRARKLVSGASTITMQLARMLLQPHPRNLWAKSQEIWLAWRLAAGMNKDEILHAYINRLPMGGNIYGVEAAAQVYFAVPSRELNLAQASILAALPNDPTDLNPYIHWEKLKKRQVYVLDRMVKDGYISRAQSDRAYTEKIILQPRQQGIIAAPHFLFWFASQLPKNHPSQIQTTIDRPLQQFVEAQVRQIVRNLAANNAHHAAALVVDNHSGEVLAYVGSPDYFDLAATGRNDGVQALRQPGSTLKPFLYQLALEKRVIRPNTVVADVPAHYAIDGAKLYSPKDYSDFQGPVRVRNALANSLNVPAVKVLQKVGVPTFLNRLHQLGFNQLNHPADYYGLGLTLGSGEVSLWELARAYVTMARHGQAIPLITTTFSNSIPAAPTPSPTWGLVIDILSDSHARASAFGVDSVLSLPFPAAVKTGTSSDFHDTWTVGFTTDYTVATWVGNFNGEPMKQVSGVMGAAPLWNRIMLHLHENKEPRTFAPPEGLVQRPICALSGLKPTSACPTIVQEYFFPEDLGEYDRNYDTFYSLVNGESRLNLPREYDQWLALRSPSTIAEGLKIISPRNGDSFLVYPNSPPQKLEFKLAALQDKPVEWWIDGERLESGAFWALRPGSWTLEVKSGEMSDRVTFEVEVAGNQPTRRGFSVAPK
ncbi:MAG: penicillin-binding protein 1C [Chroococcus sp. CMT-3BRIN-NPC107]|jgi:penicillin-binding protein 1C|nr:penicillin-binding protein 1C [Chroococcus sp. CMT-3BRIN-NPC107]